MNGDTIQGLAQTVDLGGVQLGGGQFQLMAGPCSVESREQLQTIAKAVQAAGVSILRGGAFKPRSSPYTFQGLREQGIQLLLEVKKATGLKIVTEITEIHQLPLFDEIDLIQVGARNMQNFELLRELGCCGKPVLLKRGMGNTIDELLLSAEHLIAGGNKQVILCERGIRTFEHATRYTLDISAVPVLKARTGLPVIVDPSHGTGAAALVPAMALAAVAAGADGLLIEVHHDPAAALSDGPQALLPSQLAALAGQITAVRQAAGWSK